MPLVCRQHLLPFDLTVPGAIDDNDLLGINVDGRVVFSSSLSVINLIARGYRDYNPGHTPAGTVTFINAEDIDNDGSGSSQGLDVNDCDEGDGVDSDEIIKFIFSKSVVVFSVLFSAADSIDAFDVIVNEI